MSREPVGGAPPEIHDGGATLVRTAAAVGQTATGIRHEVSRAMTGTGALGLVDALMRFGAVHTQRVADIEVQLRAAGQLAQNASADLAAAGGH
jgi:hypothetical protein